MYKNCIYIACAILIITISSCVHYESGEEFITISNESEDTIFVQPIWWAHISEKDTVFQERLGAVEIAPHTIYKDQSLNAYWYVDFRAIPYMEYLVLDGKKYKKYRNESIETIRENVPVLRVWKLKFEDLEKCNWTVSYPSYPSYKFIERE